MRPPRAVTSRSRVTSRPVGHGQRCQPGLPARRRLLGDGAREWAASRPAEVGTTVRSVCCEMLDFVNHKFRGVIRSGRSELVFEKPNSKVLSL